MNKKGKGELIWILLVLVILGIMYLLNKHAENTRDNPDATNNELIGETIYETGEDVAIVSENWLSRLWNNIFNQGLKIPPSTNNNTATQNETT